MFSQNTLKTKKGYTLSETLIALTIIGVVFTIAIGTYIADINKNATTVRLKKAYSVLSQAFNKEISRSGAPLNWEMPNNFGETSSYAVFQNYLLPNLVVSRDCKNSTEDLCKYDFKELNGLEKELNPTWTRFYLNDGMFIALQYLVSPNYKVIYFYVDTNGKKRLNVVGRDIFLFEYRLKDDLHPELVGQVLPFGHDKTREYIISPGDTQNCNAAESGNYCAALIMKDDWEIKNGYPWAQARYVVK